MTSRTPELRVVPKAASAAADARPAPVLDDSQLLTEVRAGNPRAAGAFYDRMRPAVDRTIARLLGARDEDHQDLAQLAMIELVQTIDRYRGDCSLEGWASTLTAHVVYKHIRRRQVERRVFAGPFGVESAGLTFTHVPSREVTARNLVSRVVGHLRAMEPNRAWAVTLHDVHGYDLKEMAAIMDSSVAAAQTRLSRGRRELHERIALDPELAGALERTWDYGGTS